MARVGLLRFSVLAMAVGLLTGCGGGKTKPVGEGGDQNLIGDIDIDGSSTVFPMSEAVSDAFGKKYPNVDVPVGKSGTGAGFGRFVTGEIDITNASRPIKKDEADACEKNGVKFIELPIAYDGLTIVVHPKNDFVDQLTVDQLRTIFLEEKAAKTWNLVDDSWPAEPIRIFLPGTDSGTFDYFVEVLKGGIRSDDVSASEEDNQLVTGVAGEPYAIGFFGASYYFNNQEKLKAVKIVNPETGEAVAPSAESVANLTYAPFSRPLFIYVNEKSLDKPQVQVYVEFFLEHAKQMAEKVDYVGLDGSLYERGLEHYERRLTGAHFLTESGEKRVGTLEEIYTTDNLISSK